MNDERDDESPPREPVEAGETGEDRAGAEPGTSDAEEEQGAGAEQGEGAEQGAGEGSEPEIEILGYEALSESGARLGGPEVEDSGEEEIELSGFDAGLESDEVLRSELAAARDRVEELRADRARDEAELAGLRDQLRRTAADFENYRKRIERDRVEERKQAAAALVLKLLPVEDNFGRALEQGEAAAREHEVVAGFVEGLRLIEGQFFDILRAAGLEPVSAQGSFDPAVHEALMQEPTDRAPHLSILEVFEPGYLFGGRLLRPARVKVAHNPGGEAGEGAPAGAESSAEAAPDADEADEGAGEKMDSAADTSGDEPDSGRPDDSE